MRFASIVILLATAILISGCVQPPPAEDDCEIKGDCMSEEKAKLLEDCKRKGDCTPEEEARLQKQLQKEVLKEQIYPDIDPSISWESLNGPPGGHIMELIQNPYGNHELYTTTVKGLYKSEDKGETWQQMPGAEFEKASIAPFEDGLFICRQGLWFYDNDGNIVKVLDEHYSDVTVSDNKVFLVSSGNDLGSVKIIYDDLNSEGFDWKDISPSESELSGLVFPSKQIQRDFGYSIQFHNIVAAGNTILINIIVKVHDSGEETNDQLYISEDLGQTWSRVELDTPDGVVISNFNQNPENPNHIVLSFKHTLIHDKLSPLSALLKESYDGGKTWSAVTDLQLESNGVISVNIVGSAYYLMCPYDSLHVIKLDGSDYEKFDPPRLKEFRETGFNLEKLVFDVDDPNIVYGQTGSSWSLGILKSEDGMKTWKKMDGDIVVSSPTIILTHPTDPKIVFTSGNVIQENYATKDWGQTWEPFSPVSSGDDVRIDPYNSDHMIVVDEITRLYESYDAGRTYSFTNIAKDFSSAKVFDFEIADDGSIYESNIGVGISKHDSSGGWAYMTDSPDYTYDIALDPEDNSIVYASYSPKIFENHSSVWKYSKDSGWKEIFRIEDSRGVTSLAFDELNPNNMYAGVVGEQGTVYVSNDKGQNWNKLDEDLSFTTIWGHSQLQIDPRDKNTVYAGTWGGGSYKTTDSGESWTLLDQDHTFSPVCLAISTKNPDIVYACDRTAPKIHKSTDAGETWIEYYDFGQGFMLSSAIAIDPKDPNTIYASAFKPPMAHEGGFVKITNGQATPIGESLPRSVLEIEIDQNIIYVTTHIHGVYKSEDAGITWKQLDDKNNGLPRIGVYDIDIDATDSNVLYATALCGELPAYMMPPPMLGVQNLDANGKCGAYKSTDAGETWNLMVETISEARGIDVDGDNFYVADMMGGVWVSNDAGQTWRQENNGLGSISMTSVKVKDDFIYASTQGSGVYAGQINFDNSITWDRARSNKPKAYVHKIQVAVDPTNSNRIFVSGFPGGLLRSDDGGKNWNDKNFLTPSIRVTDPVIQGYYRFAINPTNPEIVWMGVYGQGMFVSYDGMDFNMFSNGNNNEMRGKHITSVEINPGNPDEIYVGAEEGVFVSKDAGKTWEQMNNGLETLDIRSLKVRHIEYPPLGDDFEDGNADGWNLGEGWSLIQENNNYVLQGIGHNWAHTGSDSWTDYTFESKVKLVEGLVHINYRYSDDGRYAIGLGGSSLSLSRTIFGKKDGVHTDLESAKMEFERNKWYNVKIVGKGSNIKVYVDDTLKIDHTDVEPLLNGRIAFESHPEATIQVDDISITIDSTDPKIYVGTAGYGVYQFNPTTKQWANLGRSLGGGWWSPWERRMYQFSSLLFDPDVPGKIYYGHFPSGFFISEDNGHTWTDSSLGLGNDGMFSLAMHPYNHDILFAGTYNGVVKSTDRGKTWKIVSNGMPPEQWPYTVAIDDENPNIMYTSTKNGQNKGFCNRNEFCGVVMKTTDGGENWFEIMNRLYERSEFYTLLIYPPDHNILFLSTNIGVYISRDAGDSWQAINTGLPSTDNQVRDNVADNLALTPDNKYLVLGLMNYGAWKADLSNL